jgi:hypothetical protein
MLYDRKGTVHTSTSSQLTVSLNPFDIDLISSHYHILKGNLHHRIQQQNQYCNHAILRSDPVKITCVELTLNKAIPVAGPGVRIRSADSKNRFSSVSAWEWDRWVLVVGNA